MPSHNHQIDLAWSGSTGATSTRASYAGVTQSGNDTNRTTLSRGGGQAHNNLQPYAVTQYVIKS